VYVIREATTEDIPRVVELGKLSLIDGPYRETIKFNHEQATRFATLIIQAVGKVLVWEEGGETVGLLAFLLMPHYLSGEQTAQEVMWYVLPEHRSGGTAIRLLWAAEELAKKLGAKRMLFTAPNMNVAHIYERFGYKQIEIGFQKAL
jgi:GNAT superfamily N-acetyltransferase